MTKLEIALEALHNISNFDKTQCESFVKGIEDMREIADKALEQIKGLK